MVRFLSQNRNQTKVGHPVDGSNGYFQFMQTPASLEAANFLTFPGHAGNPFIFALKNEKHISVVRICTI